jgi:ribosomal protein L11 methyltransferase
VSANSSPALIIHFPSDTPAAIRDRLVAVLSDHGLLAIHEDDLKTPRQWTAHFETATGRDAAAMAVASFPDLTLAAEATEIEDDDWARRTQADLPAVRLGRVVVMPPWDRPSRQPGDVVVEIEPSRGFGTGHHQSTRLCLLLLQNRDLNGQTLVDVGTGSGVLAIVAAKLGAAFVSAIDVDADAIENARENIARNDVAAIVEAHVRDVADASLPPADVVIANLTGTMLARFGPHLASLVRPAGMLIVAGFTIDEKPMVLEAFADQFQISESAEEDDWWALVLTKSGRA